MIFLFASMVIRSPLRLKIRQISAENIKEGNLPNLQPQRTTYHHRTKKHLTKADINTPSATNPPRLPNAKTGSEAGNCLQSSVVYQATVIRNDNNTSETYIVLTETDFKTRHRNHTASFRHAKHKNSTELSKHMWTLKNDNIDYSISWRVLSSSSLYNSSSKRCNLCLIPDKRNELVSSCQHRNKALLRNS